MKWFEWIMFIVSLMPKILEILAQIEQQIGAGQGEIKKQVALDTVGAMAEASGASQAQIMKAQNIASKLIDAQISNLNKSGAMVKSNPAK